MTLNRRGSGQPGSAVNGIPVGRADETQRKKPGCYRDPRTEHAALEVKHSTLSSFTETFDQSIIRDLRTLRNLTSIRVSSRHLVYISRWREVWEGNGRQRKAATERTIHHTSNNLSKNVERKIKWTNSDPEIFQAEIGRNTTSSR